MVQLTDTVHLLLRAPHACSMAAQLLHLLLQTRKARRNRPLIVDPNLELSLFVVYLNQDEILAAQVQRHPAVVGAHGGPAASRLLNFFRMQPKLRLRVANQFAHRHKLAAELGVGSRPVVAAGV